MSKKNAGVLRKIASVFLLVIGGYALMSSLVGSALIFLLLKHMGVAFLFVALVLFIFADFGTGLIVLGAALWDWRQWRRVIGVVLTVCGSMLALVAIAFPLEMLSPQWELYEVTLMSELMKPLVISSALFGALFLAAGIALILWQRKRDKRAESMTS